MNDLTQRSLLVYVRFALVLVLLLSSEYSMGDNLIIRKEKDATAQSSDNRSINDPLLIALNTDTKTSQSGLAPGDLVKPQGSTALRRSRAINGYNIIRLLSTTEIATIQRIVGGWAQVQTDTGEFGWALEAKLKKNKSRQVYTNDWTKLIERSTGTIALCTQALRERKPEIKTPRIIYIDPGFGDTTIILFLQQDPKTAYRCTGAAYGGEIYSLDAFTRDNTASDIIFIPAPGEPLADSCYSEEMMLDRVQGAIGWLGRRICQ